MPIVNYSGDIGDQMFTWNSAHDKTKFTQNRVRLNSFTVTLTHQICSHFIAKDCLNKIIHFFTLCSK